MARSLREEESSTSRTNCCDLVALFRERASTGGFAHALDVRRTPRRCAIAA
jgi:hypothetical protein